MSQTDSGGLVDNLRRSATTERLRADHITTLELMQETMDENVSLKELNKRLLSRLAQLGAAPADDDSHDSAAAADSAKENAQMVQRLLKQEKELSDLRAENKTLKSRATADEKRIRELQVAQGKYEGMRMELQKLKDMSDLAASASSASSATAIATAGSVEQNEVTALRKQLQDVTTQLTAAQEYLQTHVPACHTKIDALSREVADIATKHKAAVTEAAAATSSQLEVQNSFDAVVADLCALQVKYVSLEAKYKDQRRSASDTERSLLDRMHAAVQETADVQSALVTAQQTQEALRSENSRQEQLIRVLQAELAEEVQRNRNNPLLLPAAAAEAEDSEAVSAFFLTGAGAGTATGAGSGGRGAAGSDFSDSNFGEFVRLRKENKSLKLQLLELSQQQQRKVGTRL